MSLTQGSSPHPTKRKRTNEESDTLPSDLPPITRSSQFWFQDGSVVIQAESTQFRVHQSVLSLHSTVLKDCFQIPQPDGEPTVDGCPILHLSDSSTDIEHLLSLFYGLYDIHDLKTPIPFVITSITIRLGRKYDLVRFVADAMRRLEHGFPDKLQRWDLVHLTQVFTDTKGLLFDIINLAYEFSINSILPAAFLRLCQKYTLEILQGEERDGQTMAILSPQALQTCLVGREKITRAIPQGIIEYLISDDGFLSEGCDTPKTCTKDFLAVLPSFLSDNDPCLKVRFPGIGRPHLALADPGDLCRVCIDNISERYDTSRYLLWIRLPQYFGWEGWSSLAAVV